MSPDGFVKILIGLGGNIGEPDRAFAESLRVLGSEGKVLGVSRLWRTRAVGPSQPDYLNAAALLDWPAGPRALLGRCLGIEIDAGRNRSREERWGPRVLDLDLLLAENVVCRGPTLVLPHPRFLERAFALGPATEVAADWIHPTAGNSVGDLAKEVLRKNPEAIIDVTDLKS